MNDLCFVESQELGLAMWRRESFSAELRDKGAAATDEAAVTAALKSFGKTDGARFIKGIADGLASYDWRTSSTPGLDNDERMRQAIFRGSSGYKEIRAQLLKHLSDHEDRVGQAAKIVMIALGYK